MRKRRLVNPDAARHPLAVEIVGPECPATPAHNPVVAILSALASSGRHVEQPPATVQYDPVKAMAAHYDVEAWQFLETTADVARNEHRRRALNERHGVALDALQGVPQGIL
jgi:hypothetical protein